MVNSVRIGTISSALEIKKGNIFVRKVMSWLAAAFAALDWFKAVKPDTWLGTECLRPYEYECDLNARLYDY